MVGKTWQQETEEASHSVSTARGSGNKKLEPSLHSPSGVVQDPQDAR